MSNKNSYVTETVNPEAISKEEREQLEKANELITKTMKEIVPEGWTFVYVIAPEGEHVGPDGRPVENPKLPGVMAGCSMHPLDAQYFCRLLADQFENKVIQIGQVGEPRSRKFLETMFKEFTEEMSKKEGD